MPQICCKAFCWTYCSEVQHKHSTALFDDVEAVRLSTQVTSKAC